MLVADALDVVLAEAVGQHGRALQSLHGDDLGAVPFLEVVAGGKGTGRPAGRHERTQPQGGLGGGQGVEHRFQGPAGALVVDQVVSELRELVEDDVAGIGGQFGALVVDLLDVALGAGRSDDVLGIGDPLLEPGEPLPAHARGQHGHPPAAHQSGDRHPAAAVVPGRRPYRPVPGRVEPAGDDARRQAPVGGEHLVRPDHRELLAEGDHDLRVHPGQLGGQHHVHRDTGLAGSVEVVVPVHPEQVARVGPVRVRLLERGADRRRDGARRGQLGEGGQQDAGRAEPVDGALVGGLVDDVALESEGGHGWLSLSSSRARIRSGVIGSRSGRTPIASWMALAMVAATFPIGGSPIPRAPSGPLPSPLSTMSTRTSGKSWAFGIR